MPPSEILTSAWLAFLTPISIAVLALVQYIQKKNSDKKIADRAEEVKTALSESAIKSEDKIHEIHILVNSERGVLLEMYATAMEANAKLTKLPDAVKAAKLARAMVNDHKQKQLLVDSQQK